MPTTKMDRKEALALIEEKVDAAKKLLNEAAKIGKKEKIPFSFDLGGCTIRVQYFPPVSKNLQKRLDDLYNKETLTEEESDELDSLEDTINRPWNMTDDHGFFQDGWDSSSC
jgi:hypothetical protein